MTVSSNWKTADDLYVYDENGKLKLIYSNNEIGGFAFHLTQKN